MAFIGLQGANLVVASESTKVTVVNFRTNFNTVGIGALLAVIGTFIIAILYVKHVKGSILIGIVATWVLGIICQLTGLYKVDAKRDSIHLFLHGEALISQLSARHLDSALTLRVLILIY